MTASVHAVSKPDTMGAVLAGHYGDFPLAQLPAPAVRAVAKRWRERDDVTYLEIRDADETILGFTLGHAAGPQPWRALLRKPAWVAPLAAGLAARRKLESAGRRAPEAGGDAAPLPYPKLDEDPELRALYERPFLMSEYTYVMAHARGRRIATELYHAFEAEAARQGYRAVQGNVAASNAPSIKALQHAGWRVAVLPSGALRVMKPVGEDA